MNLGLASLFAISTGLIDTNDNIIKLSSGGGGIGGDPGGTTPAIQAKGPYVGAAGIARKIKSIYVGVNGTARKVRAAYVGVDGAARKFYRTEPLAEVPYGTTPRNLALTVLGREVAAPSDVSSIIDAVSNTIKNGKINNLVVGDYFGLASINISAGNLAGGAFSASLADVPGGHGRNLDFVLVAKEPYYQKIET